MRKRKIRQLSLKEFLEFYRSENTTKHYRISIGKFLRGIYENCIFNDLGTLNRFSIDYLNELERGRDFTTDLKNLANINAVSYAPTTANKYWKDVYRWLQANGYDLYYWEKKSIIAKLPPNRVISEEAELNKEKLRMICENMPDKFKTMTVILAGSGMRIGELLRIKKSDIDFSTRPMKIYLKADYTKSKFPRMVMITEEAERALMRWLSVRESDKEEIFPFTKNAVYYHWKKALKDLGFDQKDMNTNKYMIHIHMLRKWFISQFSLVASKEIAELLAGHSGYLSQSYRRYTHEQISKEFLKAERQISIYEADIISFESFDKAEKIEV